MCKKKEFDATKMLKLLEDNDTYQEKTCNKGKKTCVSHDHPLRHC